MAYKDKARMIQHNNDYNKANYDRHTLVMPKGRLQVIKVYAASRGESVSAFINRVVSAAMERGE